MEKIGNYKFAEPKKGIIYPENLDEFLKG